MQKIITITLNPAIDKSCFIPALAPERKLRCSVPKFEPGGGGINVSRAIQKLGGSTTALYLAGGHTGKFFEALIQAEGIDSIVIPSKGSTRENVIITDESTSLQYRFGMPGSFIHEHEWRECLTILQSASDYEYVVISGSNPDGVPADFFSESAKIIRQKNAKFIVDTSGESLKHAFNTGIYLAKPNVGELSRLTGIEDIDGDNIVLAARSIIDKGGCEVMVISMGGAGAMLITATEQYHQPAPAVRRRSTVGAGDSMVAGLVTALSQGWPLKSVLRYGVACGSAATMNFGTELCKREDVEKLYASFK